MSFKSALFDIYVFVGLYLNLYAVVVSLLSIVCTLSELVCTIVKRTEAQEAML